MTEYCFQSTNSATESSYYKNKFSDFTILFSFILSHPLYFSYLIFFSPYLFKLLSFLSPLFFTTSLLFLSLLTTLIPFHSIINSKEGFLLSAYNTLLENSHPKLEDEYGRSHPIEEFEVFKVVFEFPTIEVNEENPVEKKKFEGNPVENEQFEENPIHISVEKVVQEGKGTGEKCESLTMEPKKVDTKPKKVKEEELIKVESIITRWESEAIEVFETPKNASFKLDDDKKFSESFSQAVGGQPYMGSFGSMRKEKEWRRTLACKLFEERHNGSSNNLSVNGGGGEEGMDLLWETHETESNRVKSKEGETKKGKRRDKIEDLMMVKDDEDEYYDDNGKFCCLQALKLSAGKMNLSMGMKFSKAFKGIGFLQNHVKKQSKKGYK